MERLASTRRRTVDHVADGGERPAVYLLRDPEAGGVLVNTPAFDPALAKEVAREGAVGFLFLPSSLGARDVDAWRSVLGARALAGRDEVAGIAGTVDQPLDGTLRLSKQIVFHSLSGRTPGTTALFCRNRPGLLFLGPALEPGADGWPTLVPHPDDWSWENRVLGALGLQDLRFEYVFTDRRNAATRFGPGADTAVKAALGRFYA